MHQNSCTATEPAAAAANATVLVVDSEALTRRTLGARLAAEGCDVLEAATGAAALEQLGDTIDVVLLDQHLPDADGLEWLRTACDQQPDLPVIPGRVPDPLHLPPGCCFAERCSRVIEACRHTVPPLVAAGDGGLVACHNPHA